MEPISVLWCVALPVIDTFIVIIKRLKAGRSPFHPDRSHFHHMLQDLGLGSRKTLLAMIFIALALVALGGLAQLILPQVSAGLFILVIVVYIYWVKRQGWSIAPKAAHEVSPERT